MTRKAETRNVTPVIRGASTHAIDAQAIAPPWWPALRVYGAAQRLAAKHGLSLAMLTELDDLLDADPGAFRQRQSQPHPSLSESASRSRTWRRMERAGLVERERADRRGSDWHTAIRVTDKGRVVYLRWWADLMEPEDAAAASRIRAEADRIDKATNVVNIGIEDALDDDWVLPFVA